MVDVERASFLRGGHADPRMQNRGDTPEGCRFQYDLKSRSILAVVLFSFLFVIILIVNLHATGLGLDGLPHFDSIRPSGSAHGSDFGLALHPEDHVDRDATTQHHSWIVTKPLLSPDGVDKYVFQINDQFPGPTIEARSGDVLEIEVLNLSEESISIHWHGLHMRGANDMDGPVGLTQCAIPPGGKYHYKVPIGDQAGTFWYQAHSEAHRGDGLFGGLIVHAPHPSGSSTHEIEYDAETLLMIGDWYHPQSVDVLAKFMSFKSEGFEPCPDSLLINGMGRFECSHAVPSQPVNCTEVSKPHLKLDKRLRYRLRVVNVGSLTGITLTVPDALLHVITVDGGLPVIAKPAASVGILYPAERMDMILTWAAGNADHDTKLQVELDNEYFMEPNHALERIQSFTISSGTSQKPSTKDGTDKNPTLFSLCEIQGLELPQPLPDPDHKFMIWSVVEVLDHNHGIPQGVVNRTSWQAQSTPLLALPRDEWDEHQLVAWTGPSKSWVELTINNIDGTGHPFHLHEHNFYVVGSHAGKGGWDYYNPYNNAEPRGGPFNLHSPLQKDTVYVPAYGYVVIRFLADHEGIWALHCHILWHQASGMSMAFQVFGGEHQALSESGGASRAREYCASLK